MTDRTIVPYYRHVAGFDDVEVAADGDIEITTSGGYYGDDVQRTFTAEQLMEIAVEAQRHVTAYQNWEDGGRDDPEDYWHFYPEELESE